MYHLYYYPSNANLAPHMVLEEIGTPYQLVLVDREQQAHKQPAYLKLNPSGLIPVLIDDDLSLTLTESAAICLHLADRHAGANLAPAVGSRQRADLYRWLMYLTNTVQATLMHYYYPDRLGAEHAATVEARAEAALMPMFDLLEAYMHQSGGPWMLGDHYTVADPFLMMMCRWTRNMANPARNRPALAAFLETMAARPAVIRAHQGEGLAKPWY
ncbi:MAG: glutathione S-transferase family protein [Betaproteobacteria bacterium]|nr:glutathione S-transferase family protein [Betaproteobacteria bacterium]